MPNFTKNAIITSFLKLLDERPLNKITVKDIVDECGINRNSFYYHFQDIPTMICEIVSGEVKKIIDGNPKIDSFEECLNIAVEFSMTHKRAVLHIYNSASRDIFENYLLRICGHIVETYFESAFAAHDITDADKRILVQFYKCQAFGQIVGWLDGGMSDDIISANHRLCELRRGMLEEIFKRCEIKQ